MEMGMYMDGWGRVEIGKVVYLSTDCGSPRNLVMKNDVLDNGILVICFKLFWLLFVLFCVERYRHFSSFLKFRKSPLWYSFRSNPLDCSSSKERSRVRYVVFSFPLPSY